MASRNYSDLSRDELVRLLEARDRRDATRFGLVWEANEVERDRALNQDFVALDLNPALSAGAAPWRNLIIEGDNFDALRYLRMTFAGRVKCIYIDPPYNTGNQDFVYNDRFVEKEDLWRHSKWVEFMHQRLTLARDLLAVDGAIVVSIDDNEVFSLGLLMKQIFGENAFIATCIWQKRYSRENREAIGDAHEYLLFFSPNPELFKQRRGRIPLTHDQAKVYKNRNEDEQGRWRAIPMTAQGFRLNQMYEVIAPGGKAHRPPEGRCWSMIESEFLKLKEQRRIYWGKDQNSQPGVIRYLSEVDGMVPWTWWPHEEVGHTDESRKEVQQIFGSQTAFTTPKPVRLIERVLQIACGPHDIVLDFFAGSGTTGQAVLKLNSEDGGNRRFILVSNAEATKEEHDKNLCRDVCAERVRKVIAGYTSRDGGAVAGLGGDFAYLTCRRIAPGRLTEIDHAQVWTALQLIHCETVAVYEDSPCLHAGDEEQALLYVPSFHREYLSSIRKAVRSSRAVILYSWQPELLRQHIRADHVQFEHIPESLARRFGLKG